MSAVPPKCASIHGHICVYLYIMTKFITESEIAIGKAHVTDVV